MIERQEPAPPLLETESPPWSLPHLWREANYTFDYLIEIHQKHIFIVKALAVEIQSLKESIFPFLDELCANTCPRCPDPCCLTARVWIDFSDLLFMHLTRHQTPSAQLVKSFRKACRYSGPKGCKLPRIARPWVCTVYLCPSQTANLRKESENFQDWYNRILQNIKKKRKKMETEFIRLTST